MRFQRNPQCTLNFGHEYITILYLRIIEISSHPTGPSPNPKLLQSRSKIRIRLDFSQTLVWEYSSVDNSKYNGTLGLYTDRLNGVRKAGSWGPGHPQRFLKKFYKGHPQILAGKVSGNGNFR